MGVKRTWVRGGIIGGRQRLLQPPGPWSKFKPDTCGGWATNLKALTSSRLGQRDKRYAANDQHEATSQ